MRALLRYADTKQDKSVAKLQVSARAVTAVWRDVTGVQAVRGSEVYTISGTIEQAERSELRLAKVLRFCPARGAILQVWQGSKLLRC